MDNLVSHEGHEQLLQTTFNASTLAPPLLGPGNAPFAGYFKNSYVTTDLVAVAHRFFATFGCSAFSSPERQTINLGDGDMAIIEVASAWAGALQLELIQPVADPANYFNSMLPQGAGSAALHHISRLFEHPEAALAERERLLALKYPLRSMKSQECGAIYRADFRKTIGHHVEGIVLSAESRLALNKLPRMDASNGTGEILGPGPAPFPGFYQFTYITNDFDRAIACFKEIYGVNNFLEIRPLEVPMTEGKPARMNCALTYFGAMEIELMNPIDGDVGIYTEMMSSDRFVIRHHHTSRLFDDYAKFELRAEEFARMNKRVVANNDVGVIDRSRFYYIDCRDVLGHYLECSIFDRPTQDWIRMIPRQ